MSFDHPLRLLVALIVCVAFWFVYRAFERRKNGRELAYSNLAFVFAAVRPSELPARLFIGAWIAALALLGISSAHPHVNAWVPAHDGSVFICIDTSGSMASTDVQPTRAQAATAAARAFVDEAPAGTKIGIIAFSGAAGIVQPLTRDKQQVIASLDQVPLPNGATAIGDAMSLAAQQLPARGHRVVIVITDGVNNRGVDPLQAAQALGARHIPVYTVGIGTNNGAIIPGTNEEATIDEDALRGYAQASGGAYSRVSNATELRQALARLGRVTGLEKKKVDASLAVALTGALLAIVTFLSGFALGRYP